MGEGKREREREEGFLLTTANSILRNIRIFHGFIDASATRHDNAGTIAAHCAS